LALIYALTIFTSAFLLFQIQPMISKAILPWFGGTPAVWTTCLLFFQTLLFAGYAYAHFSNTCLNRKWQAIVHLCVIVLAVVMINVLPDADQQPAGDADPTRAILWILLVTIGLPYFVLSATGPLLQAWFAESFPGRTPYRLYALSNVGSLLALMSYPFLFERMFEMPQQERWWTAGFIAFGILCAYVAWQIWLSSGVGREGRQGGVVDAEGDMENSTDTAESSPPALHYLLWLVLPAFGTATLMATINHICTDTAGVPLLFVVPLSLYLLTFIIAFDQPRWYRPLLTAAMTLFAIYGASEIYRHSMKRVKLYEMGMTGRTARAIAESFNIPTKDTDNDLIGPTLNISFPIALAVNFLAMFGICMLCHGELTRLRPHKNYLTAFYLMIAAGGALGGIAVSLVAPNVFDTMMEWPLTNFIAAIGAISLILYALVGNAVKDVDSPSTGRSMLMSRILLIVLLVPTAFVLLDIVEYLFSPQENVVFRKRNFFGAITVREKVEDPPEQAPGSSVNNLATERKRYALVLLHGTTIHGSQYTDPVRRGQPTSYYATTSGIGRTLNFFRNNKPPGGLRIGDVGLGTGTLAAYAMEDDFLTFYEINPDVIEMTTNGNLFTYYRDAEARGAKLDCKLGDARLTLEKEAQDEKLPRYHVLVLDAFSSDAIPTHLLTIEACRNYLPRIAKAEPDGADGALVIHVSNRYLDLSRVVRAAANELKMPCVEISTSSNASQMILGADWMILSHNKALLAALEPHANQPDQESKPPVLWTDARSNLFEILE
jgi:hypothetical protein